MEESIFKRIQGYIAFFALCFGLYGTFSDRTEEAKETIVLLQRDVLMLKSELEKVHEKVDNTNNVVILKMDKISTNLENLTFSFANFKTEIETRRSLGK